MIDLNSIVNWIDEELKNGNRLKASRLYKIFCRYAKQKYNATEKELKYFRSYNWNR